MSDTAKKIHLADSVDLERPAMRPVMIIISSAIMTRMVVVSGRPARRARSGVHGVSSCLSFRATRPTEKQQRGRDRPVNVPCDRLRVSIPPSP